MPKATSKKGRGRPPGVRSSVRLAGRSGRITEDEEDESAAEGEHDQLAVLRAQNELLRQQLMSRPSDPAATAPEDARPSTSTAAMADVTAETVMGAPACNVLPRLTPHEAPRSMLPPTATTQDLLATVLQQMTATEASATGESHTIAPFLVLGSTLDPKVKCKIWEGGYVELASLVASESNMTVAVNNEGDQSSISLTPVRARPPGNVMKWLRSFSTYAAVYLDRHPGEAPGILTCMVSILDMQRRHASFAWRLYDERSRRTRALAPSMPWHITNWDVAMEAIHKASSSPSSVEQQRSPFRDNRRTGGGGGASALATLTTTAGAPAPPVVSHTCAQVAAGEAIRGSRAAFRRGAMLGKAGLGLPTPVRAHRLKQYLEGYDGLLRDPLLKGFSSGFRIPSAKLNDLDFGKIHNHPSALSHPRFVSDKLNREAAMGRIRGPFLSPTPPNVILSPLGVVPKKGAGEYRLIHDLSFPKGNSVNSNIDGVYSEVNYELLDYCVSIVRRMGVGCQIVLVRYLIFFDTDRYQNYDRYSILDTYVVNHRTSVVAAT